jgi:hypothetical protein
MDDAPMKRKQPYVVKLPGFINNDDIGLGRLVSTITSRAGVKACDGCIRRANLLDAWIVISSRRRK